MIKVNHPAYPFYLARDCCHMIGGGVNVGAESLIYIIKSVPFSENLPVCVVTPYLMGVMQRMRFEFLKPENETSFIGESIVDGCLALTFMPEGREMLYTRNPTDIGARHLVRTIVLGQLDEE